MGAKSSKQNSSAGESEISNDIVHDETEYTSDTDCSSANSSDDSTVCGSYIESEPQNEGLVSNEFPDYCDKLRPRKKVNYYRTDETSDDESGNSDDFEGHDVDLLDPDREYDVDSILARHIQPNEHGIMTLYYYVQWKNYTIEEGDWLPVDELAKCIGLVEGFELDEISQNRAGEDVFEKTHRKKYKKLSKVFQDQIENLKRQVHAEKLLEEHLQQQQPDGAPAVVNNREPLAESGFKEIDYSVPVTNEIQNPASQDMNSLEPSFPAEMLLETSSTSEFVSPVQDSLPSSPEPVVEDAPASSTTEPATTRSTDSPESSSSATSVIGEEDAYDHEANVDFESDDNQNEEERSQRSSQQANTYIFNVSGNLTIDRSVTTNINYMGSGPHQHESHPFQDDNFHQTSCKTSGQCLTSLLNATTASPAMHGAEANEIALLTSNLPASAPAWHLPSAENFQAWNLPFAFPAGHAVLSEQIMLANLRQTLSPPAFANLNNVTLFQNYVPPILPLNFSPLGPYRPALHFDYSNQVSTSWDWQARKKTKQQYIMDRINKKKQKTM